MTRIVLHEVDLLVEVEGSVTLAEVEAELARRGLTLDVDLEGARGALGVRAWLGRGAPGARGAFVDPADHLLAGLEGALPDGSRLVVRPEPRRAVGPDLVALVTGAGERFVEVERAWLRVFRASAPRPSLPLPSFDLDPPLEPAEAALVEAIARELGAR